MDIDNIDPIALMPCVHELLELVPVSIFWKDTNSRYMGCNSKFARDAGFTHSCEIVGKSDFDLVWYSNAKQYRSDDDFVLDSGIPKLQYTEPQQRSNGCTRQLLTDKHPLRRNGRVVGVLGVYVEVNPDSLPKADRQSVETYERSAPNQYRSLIVDFGDFDHPMYRDVAEDKHQKRPPK